ncbi:MAG TPA: HEAT repeat domain-containing protein [Myxococcales bacterium]|nr:HEAT repeat domain-containing protein [Myxococcales bacterium]
MHWPLTGWHRRHRTAVALLAVAVLAGCGSSHDKLIAELQSPRPEQRALAVKKLAAQGNPDDLILITGAAKDLASIVRAEAADALGKSQDLRVVDLLGELLEDPDEQVQAHAAMALAQLKSDKSKAYLTSQYARRSRPTRLAIVQALKASNVPGAMAQVVTAEAQALWDRNMRALSEGALPERVAAAEELGKSGRAEAVNRLIPVMRDSQVILAAGAVRGLGFAGERRVTGEISLLLTENFPSLREAACEALGRLQDPSALPPLEAVAVEKIAASPHATAAILSLPKVPETGKALCDIALAGDPDDALAAGREMRRRGGCPLEPILDQLSKQKEPVAALIALEGLGPTARAAAPKVAPFLTSPSAAVRWAALSAMAELDDPALGGAVMKVCEQEAKGVEALRAKWVSSLPEGWGLSQVPQNAPGKRDDLLRKISAATDARASQAGRMVVHPHPPRELVDDATSEQLRLWARCLRAAGRLRVEGIMEALARAADDESPRVRGAALEGLAYLGPAGISAAAAGLLDADRDVQTRTAEALAAQGAAGQGPILALLPKLAGDKVRLVEALRASGTTPAAVPALISLVNEGGPETPIAAALLGELKAKEAVAPLLHYLEDPAAVGRREVVLALGQIGDRSAADEVAKDLSHDSPEVRAAAAEALVTLGSARHQEALDALKGDYYRRVRESAERALARISGPTPEAQK